MTPRKREENRRWKKKNPDKVRASARKSTKKYRAANPEKVRAMKWEQIKRWRAKYPEKRRRYQTTTRCERRGALIALLGGKCVGCGATERLDFDHRLPRLKAFTMAHGLLRAWEAVVEEAKKCDLRCRPCHSAKTRLERTAHRALMIAA